MFDNLDTNMQFIQHIGDDMWVKGYCVESLTCVFYKATDKNVYLLQNPKGAIHNPSTVQGGPGADMVRALFWNGIGQRKDESCPSSSLIWHKKDQVMAAK